MTSKSNTQFAELTGAQQTMMSWVKVIESYKAIPEIYLDTYNTLMKNSQEFPYTVLAPALNGSQKKPMEKLLFEKDDIFYILEHDGKRIAVTGYPFKNISDLEVGSILLYSWATISGRTDEGEVSATTIEFNTATRRHLVPFLDKMRPAHLEVDKADWQAEQSKFNYLASLNFKFMNYACESLVRGEKVIHSVWQQKIHQRVVTAFGFPFYRTISQAHLAILTDKEVILIWDDERSSQKRGVRDGGVWRYIPLRNITSVSLTEPVGGLLSLSLSISPYGRLEKIFEVSNQNALEHFKNEFEKRIG